MHAHMAICMLTHASARVAKNGLCAAHNEYASHVATRSCPARTHQQGHRSGFRHSSVFAGPPFGNSLAVTHVSETVSHERAGCCRTLRRCCRRNRVMLIEAARSRRCLAQRWRGAVSGDGRVRGGSSGEPSATAGPAAADAIGVGVMLGASDSQALGLVFGLMGVSAALAGGGVSLVAAVSCRGGCRGGGARDGPAAACAVAGGAAVGVCSAWKSSASA